MSASSVFFHQCARCSASFKEADSPVPSNHCIVTACFHTFHPSCLKEWVTQAEKNCPSCRATCYQHQAGKDFPIIWKIFIKALSTHPSTVLEVLESTVGETESSCPTCFEDFPVIPVHFDPETKRLEHQQCSSSSSKALLTLDIISRVVQKCAEKDAELAQIMTPSPPSFYQRFCRNYPVIFKTSVPSFSAVRAALFNATNPVPTAN